MNLYRLYDLSLRVDEGLSHDLSLTPVSLQGRGEHWTLDCAEDVEIQGQKVHDVLDFDRKRRLQVYVDKPDRVFIAYGNTKVYWETHECRIEICPGNDLTVGIAIFLERVVAPIALMLTRPNLQAFHASGFGNRDGDGWVCIGDSGAGKSTTALELLRRGYPLFADDLVLIDVDRLEMISASPTLRLFDTPDEIPEAIEQKVIQPELKKYWYRLPHRSEDEMRIPLKGIFSLRPLTDGTAASTSTLRGSQAITALLRQTFDLTDGQESWKVDRFRAISHLARAVPITEVAYVQANRRDLAQVRAIVSWWEER